MSVERRPFHEVLVSLLDLIDITAPEAFPLLELIVRHTMIPKNHDIILLKIDAKIASNPRHKDTLEAMRYTILAQKAEAEARAAEKAKQEAGQVTAADRLVAVIELANSMAHEVRVLTEDVVVAEKMQEYLDGIDVVRKTSSKEAVKQVMESLV